ncbi:unnamed protein product [Lota lota]
MPWLLGNRFQLDPPVTLSRSSHERRTATVWLRWLDKDSGHLCSPQHFVPAKPNLLDANSVNQFSASGGVSDETTPHARTYFCRRGSLLKVKLKHLRTPDLLITISTTGPNAF